MLKEEPARDENSWSAFKRALVRYRRKGDEPNRSDDLEEMVDFSRGHDARITSISLPDKVLCKDTECALYRGPLYGLHGFPGFCYAPAALSESLQLLIAYRAVSEYCESPNATNIDSSPPKSSEEFNKDESMWELWKRDNGLASDETDNGMKSTKHPKKPSTATKKYRSFKKLSWATLGYHYDWTARSYHEDAKSPMPDLLSDVSSLFARTCLWCMDEKLPAQSYSFTASASIVNYYNIKSIMGGHRDDLELALDKPIVSLSVGLPAVFLLGGKTKDDSPVIPILVRPGDVMCMGGDSRLNFHAMARLLPPDVTLPKACLERLPRHVDRVSTSLLRLIAQAEHTNDGNGKQTASNYAINPTTSVPEAEQRSLAEYLLTYRINVNVRQVYPDKVSNGS